MIQLANALPLALALRLRLGGGAAARLPGRSGASVGFRPFVRRLHGEPAAHRPFRRDYGRGHDRGRPLWLRGPACDRRRRRGAGFPGGRTLRLDALFARGRLFLHGPRQDACPQGGNRPPSNLAHSRIYLFTGGANSVVSSETVEKGRAVYAALGVPSANIVFEDDSGPAARAGHSWVTKNFGGKCSSQQSALHQRLRLRPSRRRAQGDLRARSQASRRGTFRQDRCFRPDRIRVRGGASERVVGHRLSLCAERLQIRHSGAVPAAHRPARLHAIVRGAW